MTEIWKPIPGWEKEGYEVSNLGRVRLVRIKSLTPMRGYSMASLSRNGVTVLRKVSQLVLEAFVGERRDGEFALHQNENRSDNRLDNLRWGTPQDNADDRDRNGKTARGERTSTAKLRTEDIYAIRKLYAEGVRQIEISEKFGISQSQVSNILRGESWKHA